MLFCTHYIGCLLYADDIMLISLLLSGSALHYVKKAKYLGVMLVSGLTFRCCFGHVKSKFLVLHMF